MVFSMHQRRSQDLRNLHLVEEENCGIVDCEALSSTRCPCLRKRKEHDACSELGTKFTKASSTNSVVESFMRSWMSPSDNESRSGEEQPDEEDNEDEGSEENFVLIPSRTENYIPLSSNEVLSQRHFDHEQYFATGRRVHKKASRKSKAKQMARKVIDLRIKMEALEVALEAEAGHPLSRADKMKNEKLESMIREEQRLKKEQKEMREAGGGGYRSRKSSGDSIEAAKDKVNISMEMLRKETGRPARLEDMTAEQMEAEKGDLGRLLEQVERDLGGLRRKEVRDVLSSLYERQRMIRRNARRTSWPGDALDEIPEYESLELVSWERKSQTGSYGEDEDNESEESRPSSPEVTEREAEEEWHNMNQAELATALRKMREEKRQQKKAIQDWEQQFQAITGRKAAKEDKQDIRCLLSNYKKIKSRTRLLDALLFKIT